MNPGISSLYFQAQRLQFFNFLKRQHFEPLSGYSYPVPARNQAQLPLQYQMKIRCMQAYIVLKLVHLIGNCMSGATFPLCFASLRILEVNLTWSMGSRRVLSKHGDSEIHQLHTYHNQIVLYVCHACGSLCFVRGKHAMDLTAQDVMSTNRVAELFCMKLHTVLQISVCECFICICYQSLWYRIRPNVSIMFEMSQDISRFVCIMPFCFRI